MIRATARSLFRQRSFTLAAAGTLAIGIAATTTLFTTVPAILATFLPARRAASLELARALRGE